MTSLTIRPMRPAILIAVASLLSGLLTAGPARAHDPVLGVDPATVDVTLAPGASTDVTNTSERSVVKATSAVTIEKSSPIIACAKISGISRRVTSSNGESWLSSRFPMIRKPAMMTT